MVLNYLGRLKANLWHFRLQYLILTGIIFGIMLIISPSALLEVGILAACWAFVVFATRTMGDTPKQGAYAVMGIASIIVLFWVLEDIFWWGFGASVILILGHALYRDPALNETKETAEDGVIVEVPPTTTEGAPVVESPVV